MPWWVDTYWVNPDATKLPACAVAVRVGPFLDRDLARNWASRVNCDELLAAEFLSLDSQEAMHHGFLAPDSHSSFGAANHVSEATNERIQRADAPVEFSCSQCVLVDPGKFESLKYRVLPLALLAASRDQNAATWGALVWDNGDVLTWQRVGSAHFESPPFLLPFAKRETAEQEVENRLNNRNRLAGGGGKAILVRLWTVPDLESPGSSALAKGRAYRRLTAG